MEVVCRLSSQFIAIHPHILDQFDIASNQLEMICSDMSAMTFFEAENDRVNTKLNTSISTSSELTYWLPSEVPSDKSLFAL